MRFLCFLWLCSLFLSLKGQDGFVLYEDVEYALNKPESCERLLISSGDLAEFLDQYEKFTNLHTVATIGPFKQIEFKGLIDKLQKLSIHNLELLNNDLNFTPKLQDLPELENLTVVGNPNIDYKDLLDDLSRTNRLKSLDLKNNQLTKLPKQIVGLTELESLTLSQNELLNFKDLFRSLSKMASINVLSIPVNQLISVPSNIGDLNQILSLDLRNNVLAELPDNIKGLTNLDSIKLEGNIIIDPLQELQKLKQAKLKYISLDNGLTSSEKKTLKSIYPEAEIEEIAPPKAEPFLRDTSVSNIDLISSTLGNTNQTYKLKANKRGFAVYSLAYTHFPKIFSHPKFTFNFDSTLFEERYLDLEYAGTDKIIPNAPGKTFQLFKSRKSTKGQIWFGFTNGKNTGTQHRTSMNFLNKNNPEIQAFKGMNWVYTGEMNKKTFRQKVLENHWHDLRIYFNPSANLFTLELKNQSEFLKLNCYPRYSNPNIALENSTKTYLKRMEKYNSALSKRANRFHVKLFNEKSQYKKNYDYLIDQTWSAFQQNYMSETEKGLSMTEWLDYYLQVIESEQEALNNAKFSLNNFVRHLTINQYTITSAQSTSSPIENPLEVRLCRKSGEEIEPLKVLLINNKDKTLKILNRTGATKNSIIIPSEPSTLYTVVVEGKGQIYALQNVDFEKGLNCVFLDIYNTKLLSLGEFVKKITL